MMETSSTGNDDGSTRSAPTSAVATLLGVYTALYLAVVGAIHFASSPDAVAAVVPEGTSAHNAATAVPAERFADTNGLFAVEPIVADDPDNARECIEGTDTSCIYN
jgi:hypothetical protein